MHLAADHVAVRSEVVAALAGDRQRVELEHLAVQRLDRSVRQLGDGDVVPSLQILLDINANAEKILAFDPSLFRQRCE